MTLETWQEQMRRGGLDLAILLTVSREPRYGLEIIRHLESATDLVVTEGTVYPILTRLSREGILASEWVDDEGPHPRKYYRLTRSGRSTLDAMLARWDAFTQQIGRLAEAAQERSRP
jgi:PadR family transcriptional regulator PadR